MRALAGLRAYTGRQATLSLACKRPSIGGSSGCSSAAGGAAGVARTSRLRRASPFHSSHQAGAMEADAAVSEAEQFANTDELAAWLAAHGIDPGKYGKGGAKTVAQLLEEVACGESVLGLVKGAGPARLVSVVNVYITHPSGTSGEVLWEARQQMPDGRERRRGLPLSEKMLPGELWRNAAVRGIVEELATVLPPDWRQHLKLLESSYRSVVESQVSPSYPGLTTRYTCHAVRAELPCLPTGPFQTREVRPGGELTTWWEWRGGVEVP